MKRYTNLSSWMTIYNLITIERIMKYFSLIANIDKMDLCKVGIQVYYTRPKIYFTHLIHPYFVFYLSQGYSNILKNVLYVKKLAVDQLITSNRSVITQKRSLVIITLSIRTDRITNGIYNARLPSMKVWTTMKI